MTPTDIYNLIYLYNHALQSPNNGFPVENAKEKRDALIKILDEQVVSFLKFHKP